MVDDMCSLEVFNWWLWVWVEGEYYQVLYRGFDGEILFDCWVQCLQDVCLFDGCVDFVLFFFFEEKCKVQKDCIVSLYGVFYEVDVVFVGEFIILCYDLYKFGCLIEVWYQGKKVLVVCCVDVYVNCFVKCDYIIKVVVFV